MKVVILGAGKGISVVSKGKTLPKVLTQVASDKLLLDLIIDSFPGVLAKDFIFVGGEGITEVMRRYPDLTYKFNPNDELGNSTSISIGLKSLRCDVFIVYSDTFFHGRVDGGVLCSEDVVLLYDSLWEVRYKNRDDHSLKSAEKVYQIKDGSLSLSRQGGAEGCIGEFCGGVFVPEKTLDNFRIFNHELMVKNSLSDLTMVLSEYSRTNSVRLEDLKGEWSELDDQQDISKFKFGTKSETLEKLRSKISTGIILESLIFSVQEWNSAKDIILSSIVDKFRSTDSVVVRSSALNEDSEETSMAGNYESVLNIPVDVMHLDTAITKVITSFSRKGVGSSLDQVFIQPFLNGVDVSGVIFTRDMETKAPYYVVNYDDVTGSTESVTSGKGEVTKLTYINKFVSVDNLNSWLKALLTTVKELEEKVENNFLDIEFAVVENKVFILQCRPVAAHKNEYFIPDEDFIKSIESSKSFFVDHEAHSEDKSAFGIMPDWNPAEIIGVNPKKLALSLYKELVTNHIWPESRRFLGYKNIGARFGMVAFSGKPYIDLVSSFYTLTPSLISDKIAKKLVNYYIDQLKSSPWLHDKVEYNVVFSSYYVGIVNDLKRLKESGFSTEEVNYLADSYVLFSSNIFSEFEEKYACLVNELEELELECRKFKAKKSKSIDDMYSLFILLKRVGTFSFSVIARYSFISSKLLTSFVDANILSKNRYNEFFESLNTVSKQLLSDINQLSYEDLMDKYGHLRPGTYNIESRSYLESGCLEDNSGQNQMLMNCNFVWSKDEIGNITSALTRDGLDIEFQHLIEIVRRSIEGREYFKFVFTKSLNEVLIFIEHFFEQKGFLREDIAHLDITQILGLVGRSFDPGEKELFEQSILSRSNQHRVSMALKYPPLIFDQGDFDSFSLTRNQPNFITQKSLRAEIAFLEDGYETELRGKIVVIENADPGYDWIFTKGISGLITKYGGVASHMAIRTAELGLPAVIGCGDILFSQLKSIRVIEINCGEQIIKKVV